MRRHFYSFSVFAFIFLACLPARAQVPADGTVKRPAAAGSGTVVIPDRFLRRWDAVTVFFDNNVGKSAGAPEDVPERFVQVSPAHPGAFTWIDEHTLQFRPADPWPPLKRFEWKAGGKTFELATLMSAPVQTFPRAGEQTPDSVDAVTLTFPEPLAAEILSKMVTIEYRPLPGISGETSGDSAEGVRRLGAEDFELKEIERKSPSDTASYSLLLRSPIPLGNRVTVRSRLSLDDDPSHSFSEFSFSTAEPFRISAVGTLGYRFPVSPKGSRFTPEQALNAGNSNRSVAVEFTSPLAAVDPVVGRNLVRFSPAVEKLEFSTHGKLIEIKGDFNWDVLYRATVVKADVKDDMGRELDMQGESEFYVFFPRRQAYLKWKGGQGVVERFGPKMIPAEGRGCDRFDLRIYPVAALDRNFWPFPSTPISINEANMPPGPGEEPSSNDGRYNISASELAKHISTLGSPAVSVLVDLPLRKESSASTFGIDVSEHLKKISGPDAPGHYLVGLRPLNAASERQWTRVQVTDLSLTVVEETEAVRFVATSLSTGKPVSGAEVRIEGGGRNGWSTLMKGKTSGDGAYVWRPQREGYGFDVLRIVVEKNGDVLVLNPREPPEKYADNNWSANREIWLQWATSGVEGRAPNPERLSHIFTERPVYRPEEEVHIKGYLRTRHLGRLTPLNLSKPFVVVKGPGALEWRYPVEINDLGSFYWKFFEKDRPTGVYSAYLEGYASNYGTWRTSGVSFKIEAYRIPRFEVNLHSADSVPLDADFDVSLTATYYAGGAVADRPVNWRVTQFPFTWRPKGREGFHFSSDSRFSGSARFDSTAARQEKAATNADGSATLTIDPTIEPTAQPRIYVVEATITGADDQTVTGTKRITALPPFTLGLKAPRHLENAKTLEPEMLVVGPDDKAVPGQEVTVRLFLRQWHSLLKVSDFSDGVARYSTDVVDKKVFEKVLTSGKKPLKLSIPLETSGVYIVELEARDRLGRTQSVSVDLYAGGAEPVAWAKPSGKVFRVDADKPSYNPGDEAVFVLESPYQNAEALVIVETPDENRYQWLPVRGGTATFRLPVEKTWVPRMPVHFVLMRGRISGTAPVPGTPTDLGKPSTLAATSWIKVNPRENMVEVELDYPDKSLPGKTIEVAVHLKDPDGNPLSGEVALWLVDQAVLSLGKEQRLDPLPDFISDFLSRISLRDTRGLPFGTIPLSEMPGGGGGAEKSKKILDQATIRKNFKTVPFFDPAVMVGRNGTAVVKIDLPDNLTNFMIRAKAVSGAERFGVGVGEISVRLPLIVQPALPRFVRPGDSFTASAIGRVVEGDGGPGAAEFTAEGVAIKGPKRKEVEWVPNKPERIDFPVVVETPPYTEDGKLSREKVIFKVGVVRTSDGAMDAFEVKLPIRDDRRRVSVRAIQDLAVGSPFELPDVEGEARPGTIRRSALVSDQPALVKMAAGLNFLMEYPYGCTEQRLSRARAHMALKKFRGILHMDASEDKLKQVVQTTIDWIESVVNPDGLAAYWPGADGYVSLTAWVVEFLVEARDAGFHVDDKLMNTLTATLEKSLRSDYSHFINGESWAERAYALKALARAGRYNQSYAAELSRKSQFLNLEASAEVLQAVSRANTGVDAMKVSLSDKLWKGTVFRLYEGKEVYGGLQDLSTHRNSLILPSETRTLAEMTRALAETQSDTQSDRDRLQVLINALVTLGRGDGWGSTNANAAALSALSRVLEPPFEGAGAYQIAIKKEGKTEILEIGPQAPVADWLAVSTGPAELTLQGTQGENTVLARAEASWIPLEDGSKVEAKSQGFVVSRELLLFGAEGDPPKRMSLDQPGAEFSFKVGDVIEDHIEVVNPADRYYVAVVAPLAAGMEPLNPNLANAPPEAKPRGVMTQRPSYAAYLDDQAAFYYDALPKGSYHFYFRVKATAPGTFIQPAATAEMMYDGAVTGNGNGAMIAIEAVGEEAQ